VKDLCFVRATTDCEQKQLEFGICFLENMVRRFLYETFTCIFLETDFFFENERRKQRQFSRARGTHRQLPKEAAAVEFVRETPKVLYELAFDFLDRKMHENAMIDGSFSCFCS